MTLIQPEHQPEHQRSTTRPWWLPKPTHWSGQYATVPNAWHLAFNGEPVVSVLPDGQLDHYETAVQFEFQQPKRNLYWHPFCGGYTCCDTDIALTYATNPGFYTHAYCATCRTHVPLSQLVWEPDLCPMDVVRGEPGLDLTLPSWWRPTHDPMPPDSPTTPEPGSEP